jgi:hypothetical protein
MYLGRRVDCAAFRPGGNFPNTEGSVGAIIRDAAVTRTNLSELTGDFYLRPTAGGVPKYSRPVKASSGEKIAAVTEGTSRRVTRVAQQQRVLLVSFRVENETAILSVEAGNSQ